jgi:hypothetical protein
MSLKSTIEGVEVSDQASLSARAQGALERFRRQALLTSSAVIIAVLAGVVVVLVTSVLYLHDPATLKLAFGGLGLSLGGALILLRGVWKDWNYVNLLLILLEDAPDHQVQELFTTLQRKL